MKDTLYAHLCMGAYICFRLESVLKCSCVQEGEKGSIFAYSYLYRNVWACKKDTS